MASAVNAIDRSWQILFDYSNITGYAVAWTIGGRLGNKISSSQILGQHLKQQCFNGAEPDTVLFALNLCIEEEEMLESSTDIGFLRFNKFVLIHLIEWWRFMESLFTRSWPQVWRMRLPQVLVNGTVHLLRSHQPNSTNAYKLVRWTTVSELWARAYLIGTTAAIVDVCVGEDDVGYCEVISEEQEVLHVICSFRFLVFHPRRSLVGVYSTCSKEDCGCGTN